MSDGLTLPNLGPHVGVCLWSLTASPGRIRAANGAFASLIGYSERELAACIGDGLRWQTLIAAEGLAAHGDRVREIVDHDAAAPAEVIVTARDARQLVLLVTAARADGASDDVISTCVDITAFAAAREESARANAAKSRFLAAVSHELRTPLNTISGQATLLAEGVHGAVSEKQADALARITRSERRLREVVDSVLAFSRLELGDVAYDIEAVRIEPVVREAVASLASQASARWLAIDVGQFGEHDVVMADRAKLAQIVAALVSNAIKFTDRGGRIVIDVARRSEVPEFVFLRVTDTGVGIPVARFDEIFAPFSQESSGHARTAEGLGLGLTICRDLARAMGGEVRVRSREGEGSVFTVALRAAEEQPENGTARAD